MQKCLKDVPQLRKQQNTMNRDINMWFLSGKSNTITENTRINFCEHNLVLNSINRHFNLKIATVTLYNTIQQI